MCAIMGVSLVNDFLSPEGFRQREFFGWTWSFANSYFEDRLEKAAKSHSELLAKRQRFRGQPKWLSRLYIRIAFPEGLQNFQGLCSLPIPMQFGRFHQAVAHSSFSELNSLLRIVNES